MFNSFPLPGSGNELNMYLNHIAHNSISTKCKNSTSEGVEIIVIIVEYMTRTIVIDQNC
jgi:hypothetical protein